MASPSVGGRKRRCHGLITPQMSQNPWGSAPPWYSVSYPTHKQEQWYPSLPACTGATTFTLTPKTISKCILEDIKININKVRLILADIPPGIYQEMLLLRAMPLPLQPGPLFKGPQKPIIQGFLSVKGMWEDGLGIMLLILFSHPPDRFVDIWAGFLFHQFYRYNQRGLQF